MLYFDTEKIRQILNSIGTLVNASVSLYDENFESTQAFTTEVTFPLCYKVKANFSNKCYLSDLSALKYLEQNDVDFYYYTCHFNLMELALRLKYDNRTIGYLLIGPFRDPDFKNPTEFLTIFANKYNHDQQELIKMYFKIPRFTQKKLDSLQTIIPPIFEKAIDEQILAIKKSIFSTDIEPYILNNLSQDLTIEHLCAHFFMSPKMLYTTFINNTGVAPKTYINQKRIIQAKHLIANTSESLTNIADKVGFGDYNYFIKVFKKFTGFTPLNYRNTKR